MLRPQREQPRERAALAAMVVAAVMTLRNTAALIPTWILNSPWPCESVWKTNEPDKSVPRQPPVRRKKPAMELLLLLLLLRVAKIRTTQK